MYIVIAGAGLLGGHIASTMAGEGHDVVVIEQSELQTETLSAQLDIKIIRGGAVSPSVLEEAEVKKADMVIASTNSDEANIVICFLSKQMGAKRTVARVRNPEYSGYLILPTQSPNKARRVFRPKNLGIDLIVNPEIVAANEIRRILSSLYLTPMDEFAEGQIQLTEFKATKGDILDKPINQIDFPKPCSIAVITRGTETMIPKAEDVILQGDRVYILASKNDMDELGSVFTQAKGKASSAVIIGGGRVGFHIAQRLEQIGVQVKIIEKSRRRCFEIAQRLKAVVVQGEGSDYNFLVEERVASADALVATTERSELNILLGLLGKNLGIKRILTLVDRPSYIPLAETVGIDIALSPLQLAAGKIVRLARVAEVISVSRLAGERVEIVEYVVGENAPIANKPLSELQLPNGSKILAFTRDGAISFPQADSIIKASDHAIIACQTALSSVVEKLFY
ncbi:MAG: Trk system potassium transporter TrkA [Chloroflexi bacterium]|mgnify:CR=1 FL=1|nr:Trk system potassium transporter TrkA [Chloroflexota bacterium]MBT7081723.1 Trk system potassium transporter TrkA [Chloroflexota bacterium]MBT7289193.1 Trk system potassium transporter TrkA [Chloroflexota bacterium]